MKQSEYLHFYIGREVLHPVSKKVMTLTHALCRDSVKWSTFLLLFLKPLSSIDRCDAKKVVDELPMYLHSDAMDHNLIQALINDTRYVLNLNDHFKVVAILINLGYDVFRLIEQGDAIDATKNKSKA